MKHVIRKTWSRAGYPQKGVVIEQNKLFISGQQICFYGETKTSVFRAANIKQEEWPSSHDIQQSSIREKNWFVYNKSYNGKEENYLQ